MYPTLVLSTECRQRDRGVTVICTGGQEFWCHPVTFLTFCTHENMILKPGTQHGSRCTHSVFVRFIFAVLAYNIHISDLPHPSCLVLCPKFKPATCRAMRCTRIAGRQVSDTFHVFQYKMLDNSNPWTWKVRLAWAEWHHIDTSCWYFSVKQPQERLMDYFQN